MSKIGRDVTRARKDKVKPEPGPDLSQLEERWQEASEKEERRIDRGQKQLKDGLKDTRCPPGLPHEETVGFDENKIIHVKKRKRRV